MRKSLNTALAALATLFLASCAVPDEHSPVIIQGAQSPPHRPAVPKPATPSSTKLTVYFVGNDSALVAVDRSDSYPGLNNAIGELLAGPTSAEVSGGLTSAVPVGTKLVYSSISGSTAHLDFSDSLASISGHEQLLAFAQIVVTSASIPGVSLVEISVAGEPVNAPKPDGTLAQGPVSAADYSSLLRR
ncbi:MAG TPA: GerMN domain-containing protein [Acidimicrobiales bacterium]|nr:GerMN domain-containing protein [Acidimicrobiales bacterium]